MASLLLRNAAKGDPDAPDRPRVPKVALYVSGAAFALTVGLTALVLPYVRQAAKYQQPPQFIAWRHRARPLRTPRPPAAQAAPAASSSRAPSASAAPLAPQAPHAQHAPHATHAPHALDGTPASEPDDATRRARAFNDREEDRLYGRPGADGDAPAEPVSAWLGFQALGIATAGVLGCAGLGTLAVGWALGVDDMTSFNVRVRGLLADTLPALDDGVHARDRADGTEARGEIDDDAIEAWIAETNKDERIV